MADLVTRVRELCLARPGVSEHVSHGTPFFKRKGKGFLYLWPDGHHQNAFAHLWCAAPEGVQELLIAQDSRVYFKPPYVGHRGWIGMDLTAPDWDDVEERIDTAYETSAKAT
ncbi:MmcQ/YjbR family DNA-binding protein [Dactylosporangium sp. NPDC051541]|uniref:MmcQ/YjbR family DNA-binding protein n=1 Tax=Dactylosporangium sp. NPDC051541 TaxID=3363977 RepID=UPI0037A74D5A